MRDATIEVSVTDSVSSDNAHKFPPIRPIRTPTVPVRTKRLSSLMPTGNFINFPNNPFVHRKCELNFFAPPIRYLPTASRRVVEFNVGHSTHVKLSDPDQNRRFNNPCFLSDKRRYDVLDWRSQALRAMPAYKISKLVDPEKLNGGSLNFMRRLCA